MGLWSLKSDERLQSEATVEGEHSLKRSLGALNLTLLGIGAIIGAGIFVLTGTAAAQYAGPAIPTGQLRQAQGGPPQGHAGDPILARRRG